MDAILKREGYNCDEVQLGISPLLYALGIHGGFRLAFVCLLVKFGANIHATDSESCNTI